MDVSAQHLPQPLAKSGCASHPNLQPASPDQTVAILTACLALVRPVGMSADEAEDWLRVAATDLAGYPADVLHEAAAAARRTCTHHAHLVPAIVAAADPIMAERRRLREYADLPKLPAPSSAATSEPMTQAQVDAMPAHLVRLGLACGFLVQGEDGIVRPCPNDPARQEAML